ncbi:MAG: efflux RND transporter periplasmic adaptor subunit [Verrucomicrobiae bacterium]|nr:efflux RND transporter periplasmic adaptor subunit [Verrucomicrobiae bacterium]
MKRIFTKRNLLIALAAVVVASGAVLLLNKSSDEGPDSMAEATGQIWTCSMHPQVRVAKPGKCPICSMPLISANPVAQPATTNATLAASESMLELSEHARAMASVETAPVERRKMSREIRVVGKVQYNEAALANITTRVEGYVERLFVDYTGIEVKAGDHLVEIYSPDLLVAQQELLVALDSKGNASLVESAKRKLLLWGLTQEQVDDLVLKKKVSDRITLFSPIHGTVTEKMVVQKAMVKPGEMLYRLANLESVWVYLDIYESELPWIQYGQMVETKSEAIPGQSFSGRVWFISPVLNEETRTVKVLLNINNTGRTLKPGMYVSAVIRAELVADGKPAPTGVEGQWSCPMHPLVVLPQGGECPVCRMQLVQIPGVPASARLEGDQLLSVPVSAVLDSGVRKLVYVEKPKGQFSPVEIVTGPRTDDSYPVLSGLSEGDMVAVRGSFLLDSQSQIRGLPSLFYKEGQAAVAGHQHGGASPPPARSASGAKPQGHDQHKP